MRNAYYIAAHRGNGKYHPFLRVADFSQSDVEDLLANVDRHLKAAHQDAECVALPEDPDDRQRTIATIQAGVMLNDFNEKVQEFMKDPAKVKLDPELQLMFADVLWLRPTHVYAEKCAAVIIRKREAAKPRDPGEGNTKRKTRITGDEANIRAREALKNKRVKWSAQKLAKTIDCSKGLVPKLPAWRAYQDELAAQGKKRPAVGKVVGLTPGVLANEGRPDAELQRLIADQNADFEPSPLARSRKRSHRIGRKKL